MNITIKDLFDRLIKKKSVYIYNKITYNCSKPNLIINDAYYYPRLNYFKFGIVSLKLSLQEYDLGKIVDGVFIANEETLYDIENNNFIISYKKLNKSFIKDFKIISKRKMPTQKFKNYIGVEIEFICPNYTRAQLEQLFIKAKLTDKIHIGYDGSIQSEDNDPVKNVDADLYGFEIRILDTEKQIPFTVKKVCNILKKVKAFTNKSCGLHVHLDMRNRNKDKCYTKLYNNLELLKDKVASHRLYNDYCILNSSSNLTTAEKYNAINPKTSINTIEVRLHEGTINANKINDWIKTLTTIIKYGKIIKKKVS